jgi:hypothetical protein
MIAQFALRLICGMSWMWAAMPRQHVTCGFFRIQMLVVLGLSVLAALTAEVPANESATAATVSTRVLLLVPTVVLGIAAFCGSVVWALERRTTGNAFVFAVAGISSVLLVISIARGVSTAGAATSLADKVLWLCSETSSALLLGSAVAGMLLGHWYLTVPAMSIAPLNRLNAYFGAAAFLRMLFSAALLAIAWDKVSGPTQGTWLALRWLAGIIGPLVASIMVWRILKYRNTQSATGVLFVGVIVVFIGDMAATLLGRELGVPL